MDLSAYGLTTKEGAQEAIKAGRINGDTVLGDAGTASASKYVFGKNTLKAEWKVCGGLLGKMQPVEKERVSFPAGCILFDKRMGWVFTKLARARQIWGLLRRVFPLGQTPIF